MLDKKIKHSAWFKGENMTVKQFLDYVLSHADDFIIKKQYKINAQDLLKEPVIEYFLCDSRYKMKLGYQERNYLAEHNDYFKSKLPSINPKYMEVVINANNEPIEYEESLIEFSK